MRAKFEAFIAYDRQGKFEKLIDMYARKYLLEISNPKTSACATFFVASTTTTTTAGAIRFSRSASLRRAKQFLFTSLTDCTADTILTGNIWMRGREYRDIACTPDHRDHLVTAPDTDGVGVPGWVAK